MKYEILFRLLSCVCGAASERSRSHHARFRVPPTAPCPTRPHRTRSTHCSTNNHCANVIYTEPGNLLDLWHRQIVANECSLNLNKSGKRLSHLEIGHVFMGFGHGICS